MIGAGGDGLVNAHHHPREATQSISDLSASRRVHDDVGRQDSRKNICISSNQLSRISEFPYEEGLVPGVIPIMPGNHQLL